MDPITLVENLNEILLSDYYQYLEILGRGSFGIVVSAYSSSLNKAVAIKIIKQDREENEANLLEECCHPNIVQLYKVLVANNHIYLIMERLFGQTLDLMMKSATLEVDTIRHIMSQIINGLTFIHNKGIIHRDLKPENIFICDNNTVKLIDLGLSRQMLCRGNLPIQKILVGTPYFMAPEVIQNKQYNQQVDIFSLGIIFYMMLNQNSHPLWDGNLNKKLYFLLISKEFKIQVPDSMNDMAKDFVLNTITYLPENRMTIEQCAIHPWIKGEGRKSHPITHKEMIESFQCSQQLNNLIKALMMLKYLKELSLSKVEYLKTEGCDQVLIQEPLTCRKSLLPQQNSFRARIVKQPSLPNKLSFQQEMQIKKDKILTQRKSQMMMSRIRDKYTTQHNFNIMKRTSLLPQLFNNKNQIQSSAIFQI